MKKWILKHKKIILIVCGVLLGLYLIGFMHNLIFPFFVSKVTLQTYDHDVGRGEVELSGLESFCLTSLYNFSHTGGDVDAEPCCDAFSVQIEFVNGGQQYVGSGRYSRMRMRTDSEYTYVRNPMLYGYIKHLADKHDLPME